MLFRSSIISKRICPEEMLRKRAEAILKELSRKKRKNVAPHEEINPSSVRTENLVSFPDSVQIRSIIINYAGRQKVNSFALSKMHLGTLVLWTIIGGGGEFTKELFWNIHQPRVRQAAQDTSKSMDFSCAPEQDRKCLSKKMLKHLCYTIK